MAGTLHFLILAAALALSAYSALSAPRTREKFLQEAPAPAPDSASAEGWHHHWGHPGGSDAWYLPEEVHELEKEIEEEEKTQNAEIAGLKDMFKKENKTLTALIEEFEAFKVSPHGSLV